MTLVLTALTPKHVVQASDRRVTLRYPSGNERQLNGHVKAVVTQYFACSYTGVANLRGDTADWLAIHLSDQTEAPGGGILTLASAAKDELAAHKPNLSEEPLAIICAGWTGGDPPMPIASVVSNFGRQGVEPDFSLTQIKIGEGRTSSVYAIGQNLTEDELAKVNREVQRLSTSGKDSARAIAQILTETIRSVAKTPDRSKYVSEDVLITSLPRADLLRGSLVVGSLVEDYWSVTNISAGPSRRETHGGPIIVGRKAAVQSLPPEAGPPGEGVFGARLVRVPEDEGSLTTYILTDPPLGAAWGWPD